MDNLTPKIVLEEAEKDTRIKYYEIKEHDPVGFGVLENTSLIAIEPDAIFFWRNSIRFLPPDIIKTLFLLQIL